MAEAEPEIHPDQLAQLGEDIVSKGLLPEPPPTPAGMAAPVQVSEDGATAQEGEATS